MKPMAAPAYRSLWRDPEHGLVAGVCAGLAERLGVDPLLLRAAFVAATAAGGVGVVAYGVCWLLLPTVGDPVADVWVMVFDPDGEGNRALKQPYPIDAADYEYDNWTARIGATSINDRCAEGVVTGGNRSAHRRRPRGAARSRARTAAGSGSR